MKFVHCGRNYEQNKDNFSLVNVPNSNLIIEFNENSKEYYLKRKDGKGFNGTETVGGIFLKNTKRPKSLEEIIFYELNYIRTMQRDEHNYILPNYKWSFNDDKTCITIKPVVLNKELIKYIENSILPCYMSNDLAHNIDHIMYVLSRSIKFASTIDDINYDMVYVIATYHDIGHFIDTKNHEKVSALILFNDIKLREFFSLAEIKTMAEAVCDHRASAKEEPRSIYGKIVSSADRNTILDLPLKRTYEYRIKYYPDMSEEEMIETSRQHIINKYGKNGYAKKKMYFDDPDYEMFLDSILSIADDKDGFKKRYCEVNNIENSLKRVKEVHK